MSRAAVVARDARRRRHRSAHPADGVRVAGGLRARVSRDAAAPRAFAQGTPIVAGAGDQAAGAVGMGITRPGAVSVTIGTSGVVFAATERPALDRKGRMHTFCHAIPGRWHVMGVTQAAGLSLRWLRDQWFARRRTGDAALRPDDARRRAACRPDRTACCGRRI